MTPGSLTLAVAMSGLAKFFITTTLMLPTIVLLSQIQTFSTISFHMTPIYKLRFHSKFDKKSEESYNTYISQSFHQTPQSGRVIFKCCVSYSV
jgi:hypothetical protein